MRGGRPNPFDDAKPFKAGVVRTEEELLHRLNSRRVQLGWSSRRLDHEMGKALDLTTIIARGCNSKTESVFRFLDGLGLEIVVQPKEQRTRLQRAIAAKKLTPSADLTEGEG